MVSNNDPVVLILIALIGAASGILAWFQNRATTKKMAEIEQTKVDSQAYERARLIFQASIDELEERIRRLKSELTDTRTELKEALVEKQMLMVRVEELERVVSRLKMKLNIAGIELV